MRPANGDTVHWVRRHPIHGEIVYAGELRWVRHPRYGDIPYVGVAGYDLGFQPELPPGAVRGDPYRQRDFCWHCQPPRYFYVDESKTCVQCGEGFVFGAREQQYWYEVLGFQVESVAIRCPACRRAMRTNRRLERASRDVRERPHHAGAHLELAAAAVAFATAIPDASGRKVGRRKVVDKAIAAARRAAALDPHLHLAHYWEGRAQELADRPGKAVAAYQRFVTEARRSRRRSIRKLVGDADQRLGRLRPDDAS